MLMFKNRFFKKSGYRVYKQVNIGENVKIGFGSIIYPNVTIGDNCIIGPYTIIGEPTGTYYNDDQCDINKHHFNKTIIGSDSIIRSHSIIYEEVSIGEKFQSGHRITIREKSFIGTHCSVGTLSDLQNRVIIGNHVRIHSNVFMGQASRVEDFAWIYPGVVLTNDTYPPNNNEKGVLIKKYAVISASSVILPGIIVGENAVVGANSVVTKNVEDEILVVGNPARVRCSVREIKDEYGNQVYPWKNFIKEDRGYPWQIKK